jgi:hypothetical protein
MHSAGIQEDISLSAKRLPPSCQVCRHLAPSGLACAAYKEGIPQEILSGTVLHTRSFAGDRGITFRKVSPHPSYFMTADPPGVCLFRIAAEGSCERYVPIMDDWEPDEEFVRDLLISDFVFCEVESREAETFIEQARKQKDTINPCTLQFRQMMYQHSRNESSDSSGKDHVE